MTETGAMNRSILSGVNVLDLSWVASGPRCASILASLGASVVRIESPVRIDPARGAMPLKDGLPGIELSGYYAALNTGKKNLCLDLKASGATRVMERLIRWADVTIESFTPGTLAKMGWDYQEQKKINRDIIVVSFSLFGQSGGLAGMRGFGMLPHGMSGLAGLIGWPDRLPDGFTHVYPDYVAPLYGAFAIVAALHHRDRAGEGQHIDVSLFDITLNLQAATVALYTNTGVLNTRNGNEGRFGDDILVAPHGVYPCAGSDEWIAITVLNDEHWDALRGVLAASSLESEEFATAESRRRSTDLLDAAIANATRTRDASNLMTALQASGVPAGKVLSAEDLNADEQMCFRRHFVPVDHPTLGQIQLEQLGFRFSESHVTPTRSPLLGEHNELVMTEWLKFSKDEYYGFLADGTVSLYGANS
jgi:benzylsuccinate CoA-transferase BbsF subunit